VDGESPWRLRGDGATHRAQWHPIGIHVMGHLGTQEQGMVSHQKAMYVSGETL
jgi:hypothetical protein